MKLSLISEVFQKPSMDGVESDYDIYSDNTRIASATYTFSDSPKGEDVQYEIKILTDRYSHVLDNIFGFGKIESSVYDSILDKIKSIGGQPVRISLEADESYNKTGFNNEFYVYGKVIACIHDFMAKSKPVCLIFSGYTSDMDRVYDRLMKVNNKMWPEYAYIPISPSMYALRRVFDVLNEVPEFKEWYDYNINLKNTKLNAALDSKKRERSKNLQNAKIDKVVSDNIGKVISTNSGCEYTIHSIRNDAVILTTNNDNARKRSELYGETVYISKKALVTKLMAGQYSGFLDLLIRFI